MASQPPHDPTDPDGGRRETAPPGQPTLLLDGKYRVERVIGEGAFGRVYLAQDTRLRRPVAIKELLATRNATDPDVYARYLDRFGREARAGGAITHPNVVTVYEMAVDDAQNTYLVMEYVDGTNLRDLLAQVSALPAERVVAIALDIARGLEAVHEADIVHRDLKPANIMISRRGGAKVGDFGIAQVGTESQRTQTTVGHPGTPLYMSPEQASGYGYIDGRSDLYSLGLIIYEMLVGEPFARRRVPLAQAKPNTAPALVAIVERLLQKDPDRRFQSASETVTELGRLSGAPQPSTAAYGFASGQPPTSYAPGPPSQPGGYATGPGTGVPAPYGRPPSQVPPEYGGVATPPPGAGYPAPPAAQGPAYAPLGNPPPGATGTQQMPYAPPPKRGLHPAAIGSIIAGVALVVAVIAIVALASRGGGTATATPTLDATTIAATSLTINRTAAAGSTSVVGTLTAVPPVNTTAIAATSTAANRTVVARNTTTAATLTALPTIRIPASPTATPATRSTPTGAASVPAGAGATQPVSTGSASAAPRTAMPLPTASTTVKLNPGAPLPTAPLPQVYVDTDLRYTLRFPQQWKEEAGDANTDVQFSVNGETIAGITSDNLNGAKKPSAQQIADQLSGTFAKQLTNFTLTDATQVKVANQDGVRMLYTFTDKANTVTLGGYVVAYATDTTLVLLSGYTRKDAFAAMLPTFDTVAASLTGGFDLPNTYNDAQKRFNFDYPSDWAERQSSQSAVVALVASAAGTPSFNVVVASAGGRTLQQYYDANVRGIADPSAGLKGYKKVSEADTTVSGQPAKMQVYTADLDGNGSLYELTQWYIVKEGTGYVLTYSVLQSKAAENAGLGPAIASTFTFA